MTMDPGAAWRFRPLGGGGGGAEETGSLGAPPADPTPGVRSLDEALGAPPKFPQAVIGLFGAAKRLLGSWAPAHRARLLPPPAPAALLDGSAALWPDLQEAGDAVLVIPSLERCFLRHPHGLRLLRRLIESTWGRPGRLLLGCDAWAWTYLRHAIDLGALCPAPVTAPALLAVPADPDPPLPELAPRAKEFRLQAYVLHALLIHDGLPAALLPPLLPFRATQILQALAGLRDARLAFEKDGLWRVSPRHYADLRRRLAAAEFWVADP